MRICNLLRNAPASLVATLIFWCVFPQTNLFAQETNVVGTNIVQKPAQPREQSQLSFWEANEFKTIAWAFVVGSLGAGAFFFGIFCGFISREARERLLEFLTNKTTGNANAGLLLLFCVFGGIVAAVFQAAQASVFAPIQAFVLGATWPSVVTRIMSGNGNPTGLTALANSPPSQIPTPRSSGSANADDAQVVIKPKGT